MDNILVSHLFCTLIILSVTTLTTVYITRKSHGKLMKNGSLLWRPREPVLTQVDNPLAVCTFQHGMHFDTFSDTNNQDFKKCSYISKLICPPRLSDGHTVSLHYLNVSWCFQVWWLGGVWSSTFISWQVGLCKTTQRIGTIFTSKSQERCGEIPPSQSRTDSQSGNDQNSETVL